MRVDLVRRGLGIAALAQGGALAVLALSGTAGGPGLAAGVGYALLCDLLIVRALTRGGATRVGIANGVTWARCALVGAVVALIPTAGQGSATVQLAVAAAVAILLDGVDGRVARTTGTVSPLGSRFDMEVDASLVLALSIVAVPRVGPWVVLLGAARYLLLLATLLMPRLAEPTPPRLWRKVVAVVQGVVLTVVCARMLPAPVEEAVAVGAGLALAWSFGTQIHALLRAPRPVAPAVPERADARAG
jgi:phosphatidylglycerophosphate synthase